jgi:ATP-binding cassette subfamily F protein 3
MLLQDVVDELLVFEEGNVRRFLGSYREYLALGGRPAGGAHGTTAKPASSPKAKPAPVEATKPAGEPAKPPGGNGRPTGKKKQRGSKNSRFWHLSDAEIEQRIETTEAELKQLDQQLASPELYKDREAFSEVHERRQKLARDLEPLETEWLRRADEA